MTHWCVYVGHWTVLRGGRGASLRTKAVRDGGSKRLAVGTRSVHAETSEEAARLVLQDSFTGAEVAHVMVVPTW